MNNIKKLLYFLFSALLISCGSNKKMHSDSIKIDPISFYINLNDRSNDTFKVEATNLSLSESNSIYQFAATAPGTYQVMDIGRFVVSFKAFDKTGDSIQVNRLSVNQFEFAQPKLVKNIKYEISETFDTPMKKNPVYPMAGTSIEEDHALINAHAVLGYFSGKQDASINLKIDYPENWMSGTALDNNNDIYFANSFDHMVDSPILLGELSTSTTDIAGTKIDILTYSENILIHSDMILESLKDILISADQFLNGLPVNKYTFLFHFENNNHKINGAWEHSYSSEYTNQERPWNQIEQGMKDMVAHEFFHIVTPLNIHSEIVQEFNFIEPVPSRHLWLYEGTTEWASHMMQFKSGQKSTNEYLNSLQRKVFISSNYFDNNYSLLDLSLKSYTENGHKQYGNIYMKGALVAGLLDIKLLELSKGKTGLIDIINTLSKKYGPNKAFDDASFFDEFVKITHPEIEEFMNSYVKNSNPLPYKEYYSKIGILYNAEDYVFSVDENASEKQVSLRNNWMRKSNN